MFITLAYIFISDVLSMTELAAAIVVVSLPALKSLLHGFGLRSTKQGTTQSGSGYHKHPATVTSSNHFNKLSSGRDHHSEPYGTTARIAAVPEEDSGSEVELTNLQGIYKSARVSVTYQPREDGDWNGTERRTGARSG
jgi:hypothetical protein